MSEKAKWWKNTKFETFDIICQEKLSTITGGLWSNGNHVLKSESSVALLYLPLVLVIHWTFCFLLKPLHMHNFTQVIVGTLLGALITIIANNYNKVDILPPPFLYIVSMFSSIAFFLHLFMLGVETNANKLKFTGKKIYFIAFTGVFLSVAFSIGTYVILGPDAQSKLSPKGKAMLIIFGATNYFMTTSSHLNDLGISNSEIGRLAASVSVVVDLTVMVLANVTVNVIDPLMKGDTMRLLVILYYIMLLLVCRPAILYIVNLTPEGRQISRTQFVIIIVIVLLLSMLSDIVDQQFSVFLLALTLPEEPLASILSEKLDTFVSGILFPFFFVLRGMDIDLPMTKIDASSGPLEPILLMGYAGKFLGTTLSSSLSGFSTSDAIILSLIMSSRGLLDIASLAGIKSRHFIYISEYTLAMLHVLLTGALLPIARVLYKPSRQHSTILRQSVIDNQKYGAFQTLACVYNEENIPEILQLLKLCHPLQSQTNSIFTLQLLQLTGRCALPIMGPLHQVSSMSSFRSNISRCNRIVNAFLYLERETEGRTRVQHYIAMTSYDTMHDDICSLAHEKSVSLIILPFHTSTRGHDDTVQNSSVSIREVNKMVLQHAPCSVGVLVDKKGSSHKRLTENDIYHIAVIFIGGSDDYEAIAYSKLFAMHPTVCLTVIYFKPTPGKKSNHLDFEIMNQFRSDCVNNERIVFREVIVNNGAETIQYVVTIKDEVDLVILGKHHDIISPPVFGLSNGWTEYPELGVLGDVFATPDFEFSLLIIQLEQDVQDQDK